MALQAPARLTATKSIPSNSSLTPSGNAMPAYVDRRILSLLNHHSSLQLFTSFLHNQSSIPLAAAKISSKDLYAPLIQAVIHLPYIYNDRTPFEKLPDKYFCPGKSISLASLYLDFGQLRLAQYSLTISVWVRVFLKRLDKISSIASCSIAVQAVIRRVIERFCVHDQYYSSVAVCSATKRRFRSHELTVTKNANATDARKARKADIQATLG
ncbi:hypothetical protein LguiB_023053 [Lonicera macranthoides]